MSKQRGREFSGVFTYHNPIPLITQEDAAATEPDDSGISSSFLIADDDGGLVVAAHQRSSQPVGAPSSHDAARYQASPSDEEAPHRRSSSIHAPATPPMVHVHRQEEIPGAGKAVRGGAGDEEDRGVIMPATHKVLGFVVEVVQHGVVLGCDCVCVCVGECGNAMCQKGIPS